MSAHKSSGALRRTPSSRPHTAGANEVPVTTSMELLPPEAACSPAVSCSFNKRPSSGCSNGRDTEASVVRLSSTKQLDTTTQQSLPVGMLFMQRPNSQASQQLSNGSFNRNTSHRYTNNTATIDAISCDQGITGGAVRPCSADSTHSMLVAGVPGPLPSTTPGTLSRLWSPESCLHGMDDSANSRACTANQGTPVGDGIPIPPSESFPQQGIYNPEHAEYYKYLESRPATQENGNDHAFVVPNYADLDEESTYRQSMYSAGGLHQQDSELPPGTPQSVASGVVRGSGVFFTALRRSVGGHQPLGYDDGVVLGDEMSMLSARSIPQTDAMSCYSQCNPMQEPSAAPPQHPASGLQASGPHLGTEEDEDADGASRASQQDDPEAVDYLSCYDNGIECSARSVWDNPVQTPADTTPPTAEPSQASFMSLLRGLYHDGTDVGAAVQAGLPDAGAAGLATMASEAAANQSKQGEQEESAGDDDVDVLKAALDEVDKVDGEQQVRRQELSEYMAGLLQGKSSEDGSLLVELPRNYAVLVEQMLGAARKAEYSSLAGWLGPRRFEDLPINTLPDSHEDPRVCEGLKHIKALDAKLAGKEAEAVIMAREKDPGAWAAAEKARLARQAAAVEQALRKERMRRMRAAQLARAFENEDVRASTALSVTSTRTAASIRTLGLQPDEEALVEAVLQRPDTEDTGNPFELSGSAAVQPDDSDSNGLGAPALTLAPLQLSNQLLQGESSATQLITAARKVAVHAHNNQQQTGEPSIEQTDNQQVEASALTAHQTEQGGEVPVVDLALGLAVHSRALLRAQQAAIAGMPLAAIDAHLEQLAAGHTWTSDGILADFGALRGISVAGTNSSQSQGGQQQQQPTAQTGRTPQGREQQAYIQGSPQQPPPSKLQGPGSVVQTSPSNHDRVAHVSKRRDYLREEREAKELLAKEAELDARIRAFKTSDPAETKLDQQQLAALVAECRTLAERAEAAASRPCSAPSQSSTQTPSSRPISSGSEAISSQRQRPRSTGKAATSSLQTSRPGSANHKASSQASSRAQTNKLSTPTKAATKISTSGESSLSIQQCQKPVQPGAV